MKILFPKVSLIIFLSVITAFQSTAQEKLTFKQVNKRLNAAQANFTKVLSNSMVDNDDKEIIKRFITTEIDSMQKVIKADKKLTTQEQVLALNCQCNLLENLKTEISNKSVDVYQIRDSRNNFIPLWENIRSNQSCDNILAQLGIKTANIMAAVFKDYPEASKIRDIATLKTLERTPDKIMSFLSITPDFRFKDSLIFTFANTQPERFIVAAQGTKDEQLSKAIQGHASPLIKTLLSLSKEKNYKNYLPFAGLLSENKITLAEIDKARTVPSTYYKMMVDAELDNQAMVVAGKNPLYLLPLRQYLKEYAILFYTDVINSLHEEPKEKARFFVLEDLRPQDLYFVLIGGENELYTSSYLYTYKKLMSNFSNDNYDSLFRIVNYDRYRKFLLLAGRYNTLSTFMKGVQKETRISIIKRFINGLEKNESNQLEETINVAETLPGIVKDNELATLTLQEIKNNYTRTKSISSYHGMKLYTVLTEIFAAVKNNELGNKTGLSPALAVYYKITHQALRSKGGTINQLILFYGDDDGKASYNSFLSNFSDASMWSIEKNASWVTIKSKKLYPIAIYANLPLNNDEGLDVKAQESLNAYLKTQQIIPHILIHRGHSYHLNNSIKSVAPTTALAIIGSCGGYKEIFDILKTSPAAQVISTKQVGSQQVNEPIIRLINDKLLHEKDLDWADIWSQLDTQLKSNKLAFDYFQEYVPPYKNISLLVATLYYTDAESKNKEYAAVAGF